MTIRQHQVRRQTRDVRLARAAPRPTELTPSSVATAPLPPDELCQIYCSLHPAETVERLADDYTERLLGEGYRRFQLIGYCVGGLYAVEVARRLLERGIELDDLVLASSHPVLVEVEEDLMIETLFIPNLGITPDQLGFGAVDPDAAGQAFARVIEQHRGWVPAGSLVEVGGSPELDAVAAYRSSR
jgi:pyochelin synthetase